MATVAEGLRKKAVPVRGSDKFKFQNPNRPAHRAGLERRKELQGLLRGHGPAGAQRLRAAPRTSQPQVQKGKRPGGSPAQALLRTGRPQQGGFARPGQRRRGREPR